MSPRRAHRTLRGRCATVALTVLVAAAAGTTDALAGPTSSAATSVRLSRKPLEIKTAPPISGLQFVYRGQTFVSDANGVFVIPRELVPPGGVISRPLQVIKALSLRLAKRGSGLEYRIERFYAISAGKARRTIRAAIDAYVPVRFSFVDRFGRAVNLGLLDSMTIKRSDGAVFKLTPRRLRGTLLLQASRVVPLSGALVSKALDYRIQSVLVGGNNVVNRAQQAFTPLQKRLVRVRLLFYSARVSARDRLFGFGIGSGIRIVFPDGNVEHVSFGDGHRLFLPALPRGNYHVSVDGGGLSGSQPLSITRDQVVELKVLSHVDIVILVGLLVTLGVGLVVIGRWPNRRVAPAPEVVPTLIEVRRPIPSVTTRQPSPEVPRERPQASRPAHVGGPPLPDFPPRRGNG